MSSRTGRAEALADELAQRLRERKREIQAELRGKQLAEANRRGMLERARRIAAGDFKAHVPPTEWSFLPKLEKQITGGKYATFSDEEKSDLRSFWAWHGAVMGDVAFIVEVLDYFAAGADECDGEPGARLTPELHDAIAAKAGDLKEAYRRFEEQGKIEWMPRHFYSHRLRDPRRRSVNAIEFLQAALMGFDSARQLDLGA